MRITIDTTTDQPRTAIDALSAASELSRQKIKDAMNKGACWWTHKGKQVRLRRATRMLQPGTRLKLYYDDAVLTKAPPETTLLEDKARYSVWFKPHGMLAQGSQWGDHCSLLRLVETRLQRPCHLVHRLDADAAGLMLIAHDPKAAGALSKCFAGRTLTKHYRVRVTGRLDANNRLLDSPVDGKTATSWISTRATDDNSQTTLLDVRIDTGRKHQIRRHLAGIGHPVIGDRLYGQPAPQSLQLLANYLQFDCPVTGDTVTLSVPEELNTVG